MPGVEIERTLLRKKKKRRVGGGNGIGMETQFLLDI